jgi:glycosyltransferase involved in cell wall biosynthesis
MYAMQPLVSIICLSHHHAPFIRAAVESVWGQTYTNIELILADDASTDGSAEIMQEIHRQHPSTKLLLQSKNQGNCQTFNEALKLAQGEFIIDLAADDLLLPHRVAIGVEALTTAGKGYGVHYTQAELIDASGNSLGLHQAPGAWQGDVYRKLIRHYFICPPTMMMRREVFDALGGYDASLAYEDFDFWIRSSREFDYLYSDKVLVNKRVLPHSLSAFQSQKNSPQMISTLRVCEKILKLNRSRAEHAALLYRLTYELYRALKTRNFHLAGPYMGLMAKTLPRLILG